MIPFSKSRPKVRLEGLVVSSYPSKGYEGYELRLSKRGVYSYVVATGDLAKELQKKEKELLDKWISVKGQFDYYENHDIFHISEFKVSPEKRIKD